MAAPIVDDRTRNGTIFQAEGINLTLGGNHILRDLSCSIEDIVRPGYVTGQVVALLGPSGVGKTQFFNIAAGLTTPNSGTVRVGHAQTPVQRGQVGVVMQNYLLFRRRTVLSNLMKAGRMAGLSRAEARERAFHYLERFKLTDRAGLYPKQLSGGQRQRIAIAQQLICSEHFLFMDEPFSGLDPLQLDNVIRLLFEIASMHELNTIVVVTHDVRAAVLAADVVWLMGRDYKDGKVVSGARIVETMDLVPRGLAWWQNPTYESPRFYDTWRELEQRFATL